MKYLTIGEAGIPNKILYDAIKNSIYPGFLGFFKRRISIKKCEDTKELSLRNDCTNLDFLRFFPNLENLFVSSNNLSNIQGLSYVPKLTYLSLLSGWKDGIDISPVSHCSKLKTFKMFHTHNKDEGAFLNGFETLKNLTDLESVNLRDWAIADIGWISNHPKLAEVTLSGNPIGDALPLQRLPNLKELYLADCGLTNISFISAMSQLTEVLLSGNPIGDISPLQRLPDLKRLYLAGCGLTDISLIGGIPQLEEIVLSENAICDLSPLQQIGTLRDLSLNNCGLTDISSIGSLSNLTSLDLCKNQIKDFKPLLALGELELLCVSRNGLTDEDMDNIQDLFEEAFVVFWD